MPLRILVAVEEEAGARMLESILRQRRHGVTVTRDVVQAVERCHSYDPDLVILELSPPGVEGIEAARRIRASGQARWVPIVFYAAQETIDDIVRGIDAGGDDYLIKPAVPDLVAAKINSYNRLLEMQHSALRQTRELSAWRAVAEEQSRLGQHVMNRLLAAEGLSDPLVQWLNTPAENFSGDLVCAVRGPSDILYLMLADSAGHGLSAALSALPMTQIFYGMAGKGFSIEAIAAELNKKLKSFLPLDRFVAASLVALNTREQTIEVWNGGNPDILLLSEDGAITLRWPSRNPPLGILPQEAFSAGTEKVNYLQAGELCLYSDGVIEAENEFGLRLSQQGLERLLCAAPPGRRLETLNSGLAEHLDGNPNHDDLSCILVRVPLERRRDIRPATGESAAGAAVAFSDWRLDLSWGDAELQRVDVVPAVLGFVSQIPALNQHRGNLYLILSELFNNALDHGLLALDSTIKQSEDGFDRYLAEREKRMSELVDGRIDISFHLYREDHQAVLDLRVADSGQGFDHETLHQLIDTDPDARIIHGRGIMLVQRLCRRMTYSERGNAVTVQYELK